MQGFTFIDRLRGPNDTGQIATFIELCDNTLILILVDKAINVLGKEGMNRFL